jgi:hypothetical protein
VSVIGKERGGAGGTTDWAGGVVVGSPPRMFTTALRVVLSLDWLRAGAARGSCYPRARLTRIALPLPEEFRSNCFSGSCLEAHFWKDTPPAIGTARPCPSSSSAVLSASGLAFCVLFFSGLPPFPFCSIYPEMVVGTRGWISIYGVGGTPKLMLGFMYRPRLCHHLLLR